jgi:ABC-type phosphate/phosphonate transport system substrate-binding protein
MLRLKFRRAQLTVGIACLVRLTSVLYTSVPGEVADPGACAINAQKSHWLSHLISLATLIVLVAIAAACGGGAKPIPPTLPPAPTPTPRSTALPTVATQEAIGSESRPYQVVIVPPASSSATGTSLQNFLKDRTGKTFKVEIVNSYADVLSALCSDVPTFGWVDGLALLAADAQGCSTLALKITQGSGSEASTGFRVELVARSVNRITTVGGLKDKDFCRVSSQDLVSWLLPVAMMRAGGVNPFTNLHSVKEYSDTTGMLQAIADGTCVAAGIPAGTLSLYTVTDRTGPVDITRVINPIGSPSPEMPYGGLMVSNIVPADFAATVTRLFLDNPEQLKDLVSGGLAKATPTDFAEIEKYFQVGGLNLKTLGQ